MLYRRDSGGFKFLQNIEHMQAVPNTDCAVSDSMQTYNEYNSFFDEKKMSSDSMDVNYKESARESIKMPSVVPDTWTDEPESEEDRTHPSDEIKSEHDIVRNKVTNNSDEERLDGQLLEATNQALESGSLMPLIKEELKWVIQSKRLKEGKGELKVDFNEPGPYTLTEEEEMKVIRRRDQNREAARRFRERQKSKGYTLQKECQRLESLNTQLRHVASVLKQERNQLRSALNSHLRACPYRVPRDFATQDHVPGQNHMTNNT